MEIADDLGAGGEVDALRSWFGSEGLSQSKIIKKHCIALAEYALAHNDAGRKTKFYLVVLKTRGLIGQQRYQSASARVRESDVGRLQISPVFRCSPL